MLTAVRASQVRDGRGARGGSASVGSDRRLLSAEVALLTSRRRFLSQNWPVTLTCIAIERIAENTLLSKAFSILKVLMTFFSKSDPTLGAKYQITSQPHLNSLFSSHSKITRIVFSAQAVIWSVSHFIFCKANSENL